MNDFELTVPDLNWRPVFAAYLDIQIGCINLQCSLLTSTFNESGNLTKAEI